MALPKTLKNFDIFQDGVSFMGQTRSVTLPKLARKMEDFRAGGMDGTLKLDVGADAMEMNFSAGGYLRDPPRRRHLPGVQRMQDRTASHRAPRPHQARDDAGWHSDLPT